MGRLLELPEEGVESKTFVFLDEGHTLGNALRYVISQYPKVTMCGYTLEHPAESKMLLRIQTKGGNAYELLKQGLEDLAKICDHTIETFDKAYEKYESKQTNLESTL
ncbi:PREDICTED: probable DNA-directed RNA polymerases I and III subunit RPAC2 [Dinoponera quadriceps]|uniref:DNA-directed RNA polymerase I subunit D n=1 Tax=Dinoponera quadriceps TaxID=609295 RepID=A0A6P3WUU0_DINQU|nr:PREDICTED: probable DNA-directed RNA polymerases I and III subunit RPAC2 [Dinoponera quadriceps]